MNKWVGVKWEQFKEDIKLHAIERASLLNFKKTKTEKDLPRTLHALVIAEGAKEGKFAQEIKKVKRQLEVIDSEKYRGADVGAWTKKLCLSEDPTRRALSDEKKDEQRTEIRRIQHQNNVT